MAGIETQGVGIVGGTIARTHARVYATCLATDTKPGFVWGTIVTDQALSKPDPSSDFFISWLHWGYVTPQTQGPVQGSIATQFGEVADIRSRRRLDEMGDKYFLVLANTGSAALSITYGIRTLVLLP
jgi:hypothetical protein